MLGICGLRWAVLNNGAVASGAGLFRPSLRRMSDEKAIDSLLNEPASTTTLKTKTAATVKKYRMSHVRNERTKTNVM
jgi:hypothetical protein